MSFTINGDTLVATSATACVHCGTPCGATSATDQGLMFCCLGCQRVYALLHDLGMQAYYELQDATSASPVQVVMEDRYAILEQPKIWERMLDHRQGTVCRVTFRVPAIHCTSCVWLLENLYSLVDGVGRIEVDILRKEARVDFDLGVIALADVARAFERFGYPPELNLQSVNATAPVKRADRLHLKMGLAGFAFGNTMLFQFPTYLGLTDDAFSTFFGLAGLIISVPVLLFSASDFWYNSWRALRNGALSIDVPIALGLLALFGQSLVDLIMQSGPGYLDSLCGLVFFLLLGRWYQRRTTDALTFDRDYRSYFPLMARRIVEDVESPVPVTDLVAGDRIQIRQGELIPADSILVTGEGRIDYSFVTGESVPERHVSGDTIYAGGRQVGSMLVMDVVKPVSQSYLTSLWNDAAFNVQRARLITITDKASRVFTPLVLLLSAATLTYWWGTDPRHALTAAVAVLIVACPCALALSAPFAFGQAMRILGRHRFFVRAGDVVDALGHLNHVVFDKTGTLTRNDSVSVHYEGSTLDAESSAMFRALADQSTHPLCRHIVSGTPISPEARVYDVTAFAAFDGKGVSGVVDGRRLMMGSLTWLQSLGVVIPTALESRASSVFVARDGHYLGVYRVDVQLRSGMRDVLRRLTSTHRVGVLTGDHASGAAVLADVLSDKEAVLSSQSPADKLNWVRRLQQEGARVAMVGDGLNDAGALAQSDVGIAVTENVHAFSPSCDAILDAEAMPKLTQFLQFARRTRHVVLASIGLSVAYNIVGFTLAASGRLTPVVAAIFMPLSSITVVCVATLGTRMMARREGLRVA